MCKERAGGSIPPVLFLCEKEKTDLVGLWVYTTILFLVVRIQVGFFSRRLW